MDILESLRDRIQRKRPPPAIAKLPRKEERIYFDADLFRWWFNTGIHDPSLQEELQLGIRRGWTVPQYREWLRAAIKERECADPT